MALNLEELQGELNEKNLIIASLLEAVELMREEVARVRTNNRILRRVHSALRGSVASLKAQVEMAEANDNLFKQFCNGDFDAKVTRPVEGGLPEAGTQVESQG